MLKLFGGPLDGLRAYFSDATKLPETIHPTIKTPWREVSGNTIRVVEIDRINEPGRLNVGPYTRDDDGRYHHSTFVRPVAAAA